MKLQQFKTEGFQVLNQMYSNEEVKRFQQLFDDQTISHPNLRKGKDLFAIRHVTEVFPTLMHFVWNENLKQLFSNFPTSYRLVKSLYFDKPPQSNWFVLWHQDLTISVSEKKPIHGFINWTNKNGIIGVQPPVHYLENTITIRIHLDDCDEENGGLKVIPKSHVLGVIEPKQNQQLQQGEQINCPVQAGSILMMRPLTLHSSSKNRSTRHRRVLHLEFSSLKLPNNLAFREEGSSVTLGNPL